MDIFNPVFSEELYSMRVWRSDAKYLKTVYNESGSREKKYELY